MMSMMSTIYYHYKEGNFNWTFTIYITLVHVLGCVGLFKLHECKIETLLFAFALWPISGLGITAGAHRLWAHRSYEAAFPVRLFLMLCNSMANQASIYQWVKDHRVHHKYSETHADPHNSKRGFFFAHIGWLYLKRHPDNIRAEKELDLSDLENDPVVMIQRWGFGQWRLHWVIAIYMCFIFPAQFAAKFWGESYWLALFVAGALRYVFVLHCTFLVNSAAHLYGDHPYDASSYPSENPWVSFFAIGEGWHNWHHKYPFDYAASEFGISSQYNPTKLFLDILASVGLVWGRKRGTAVWELRKARQAKRDSDETSVRLKAANTDKKD